MVSKTDKFIVLRQLTDAERAHIIDSGTETVLLSALKNDSLASLPHVRSAELSFEQKKELNKEILQELNAFTTVKVGAEYIMEHLKYDSVYLWYYHRFRIYFNVRDLYYRIAFIKSHFNSNSYHIILTDDQRIHDYFNSSDGFEIKLILPSTINSKKTKVELLKFLGRFSRRALSGWIFHKRIQNCKNLILVNSDHGEVSDDEEIKVNRYYANLLKKGDPDKYAVLDLQILPKIDQKNVRYRKFSKESTNYPILKHEYILAFYGISQRKKRTSIKNFLRNLQENAVEWKQYLSPIQNIFLDELIALNKSSELYLFQYHCYKAFFSQSNIKSVITVSEHSSNERSILDAARTSEINTIGIQHGVIGQYNISYIFDPSEIKYHPIPEYTILWGEVWQQYLVENSCYNDNNTTVLGQLRTDLIPKFKTLSKSDVSNLFDENKKLILFASQPQKDEHLRKNAAENVITAVQKKSDLQLIIKIHPGESKSYYEQIARENEYPNCIIVNQEIDLYKLLAVSDIVITCYSTVGAEAIYFERPLIAIDPLDEDLAGYKEYDVAEIVHNERELSTSIYKILEGKSDKSLNYPEFIQKHVCTTDGNVTDRYLRFIESIH